MLKISLLASGSLLLAPAASAAPLRPTRAATQAAPLVRAHMVCDDDSNCYRTHPRRYVERRSYYDSDDYDGAYERRYYRSRDYVRRVGVYRGYGYDGPAFWLQHWHPPLVIQSDFAQHLSFVFHQVSSSATRARRGRLIRLILEPH